MEREQLTFLVQVKEGERESAVCIKANPLGGCKARNKVKKKRKSVS